MNFIQNGTIPFRLNRLNNLCTVPYCPIYAMEVCTKVYEQYHALGGNNVGTELYERLRELPTQPVNKEEKAEMGMKK